MKNGFDLIFTFAGNHGKKSFLCASLCDEKDSGPRVEAQMLLSVRAQNCIQIMVPLQALNEWLLPLEHITFSILSCLNT